MAAINEHSSAKGVRGYRQGDFGNLNFDKLMLHLTNFDSCNVSRYSGCF